MQSLKSRKYITRRFLSSKLDPVYILLLSSIVGVIAGLLSTGLDLAVNFMMTERAHWLVQGDGTGVGIYWTIVVSNCVLTGISFVLVDRLAPETRGSGIQEIEGVLSGIRLMRWRRVIPVKFLGGVCAIGSGMVLGREGPSVQMGGGVGQMVHDLFRRNDQEEASTLIAAGSAAGLAAAFNAPLAGIMFVLEEMRPEFRYNLLSIKSVIIGAMMSTVIYRLLKGQSSMIIMPVFDSAPLFSLPLFLLLGLMFGVTGYLFNHLVIFLLNVFDYITNKRWRRCLAIGVLMGSVSAVLIIVAPFFSGDGMIYIPALITDTTSSASLFALFMGRLAMTLLCFCSGAPGGFFAPMLVLGTLFGSGFGVICSQQFPQMELSHGMFAIAGMGGLFAATVRAPMTGILLVIELTRNYSLILPLLFTTLGATLVAQALGGKPIYSRLLQRTLANERQV